MATVDFDMTDRIENIAEPVILTLSIEEVREALTNHYLPDDAVADLEQFIEEYDAHGY